MYLLVATRFVVAFGMNALGVLLKLSHEICR